jgi:thiol-disulfide isomerase/thioredoxin
MFTFNETFGAKYLRSMSATLLFGVVTSLCAQQRETPSKVHLPAMHLVQIDGRPVPASALRGKAIVLNFWAPWCPPCKMEIPWLQELQRNHRNDALVIGVVADPNQYRQAKQYMASHGVMYLVVQDSKSVDRIFGEMEGLPTTFYLADDGSVVHVVSGLVSPTTMTQYLEEAVHADKTEPTTIPTLAASDPPRHASSDRKLESP